MIEADSAVDQLGGQLRRAADTLRGALPADQAGRIIADEAAERARAAAHGLTRNLRVAVTEDRLPLRLSATSVRGLGTSAEYGSGRREQYSTYRRRGHKVTRRTRRQLPPAQRNGYVVGPAARAAVPRIAELFGEAAADHFDTALGG